MSEIQAMISAGMEALRARDTARAAECLREAAALAPASDIPWIALANAELALGRPDAAEAAVDRQLALASREVGALLLKGMLREQAGHARAATSFYRAALNQAAFNGAVPPELLTLHDRARRYCASATDDFGAHLVGVLGDDLSPAMAEAVELLTGKRQIYLQQPSAFYYPGLPQRRFYEPEEFSWFKPMLALIPEMQAELAAMSSADSLRDDGFAPYVTTNPDRPAPNNPLRDDPAWSALYFWRDGEVVTANATKCPATMAALAHAPMPSIPGRSPNAHWSRLLPGAHIAPHTGMLNTRLICHIPILTAPGCTLRVGSETREWIGGVPLIFDDSIEHEARNAGPHERVVLLFEIWRPEIDAADRAAIGRIFQAIGDFS